LYEDVPDFLRQQNALLQAELDATKERLQACKLERSRLGRRLYRVTQQRDLWKIRALRR
jgi:predicted nuclease with TOPRIM domain